MVIGQYTIIEKIGEGGMGVIYKAEHSTLHQIVAIKALPASLKSNPEIRDRFIREATIQAKITHPNIVNIHNFFEYEGNYYIVMEYVEGETLDEMIKRVGLIPPDRCLSIFRQILAGIEFAHAKGIIHRDIKPGNIMVDARETVKIMDFGVAKMPGGLNLTKVGVKVGTVWYMSPEQVRGNQAGITSDIYSLGVTLFEMVTGRVPFYADSQYKVMKTIVESPPVSPKEYYPYIPESMEMAILRAMAKRPEMRFQGVVEFASALYGEEQHSGSVQPGYLPAADSKQSGVMRNVTFTNWQVILMGAVFFLLCGLLVVATMGNGIFNRDKPMEVIKPQSQPAVAVPRNEDVTLRNIGGKSVSAVNSGNSGTNDWEEKRREKERKTKREIRDFLVRGQRYYEDGNLAGAKEMYGKVLKMDSGNSAAREGLATVISAETTLKRY